MRLKTYILLTLFAGLTSLSRAQTSGSVKGQLVDSSEHKNLENTVVALLRAKDSFIVSFTRANDRGAFALENIDSGQYIAMITHPYFAEYFENFGLAPGQTLNMGILHMLSKMKLMEEVIVKGNRAMFLSGDTTVFTADSFKVAEGANVEELFRKLPGFQVDAKGNITALGKKVERLLVDGEEFFGDDPGIASKNLRADNVKEVQVYEGKSDQAAFTGIDDGNSKQTINLKLKEDKKKGYFGKLEAGGGLNDGTVGTQNTYSNQAMINSFKKKRKIAAYGIMSNTGKLNLDWNDQDKYGQSNINININDDGTTNYDWNGDSYNWVNGGTPTNWNLGLQYNDKFNEDKQGVNLGYRLVKINTPANQQTYSSNYTPDSSWKTNSFRNNYSTVLKQAINATLENKFDSSNTVKLTVRANKNHTQTDFSSYSESLTMEDRFINKNESHGSNNSNNEAFNGNLLWMHKFKKLYRTLSLNIGYSYFSTNTDGLWYSGLTFYRNGDSSSSRITDQNTLSNNHSSTISSRLAYTEPLAKDVYMEFSYNFSNTNNLSDRDVYWKNDQTGRYDDFIDSLSNNYQYTIMSNMPGINFRMVKKKFNINMGSTVGLNHWEQKDLTANQTRLYNFVNYNPVARITYNLKPSTRLYFSYNGRSSAPSLDDLQPIINNTDQLNVKIGNPDLKPSFSHNFDLQFNSFKMLNERNIYAGLSYGTTQNAFTQMNQFKDSIRQYYTVNTNGVYNVRLYSGYRFKLKQSGISLGAGPNFNISNRVDFVSDSLLNPVKNTTRTRNYGIRLNIGKEKADKYSIYLNPYINYNSSQGSVSANANAKYWSYGSYIWGRLILPKDLELSTDVEGTFRQKDPRFPSNNNYTIWNGFLSKKFHKKVFELKLSVYDILNQNQGYNRNFDSYSFTENYNNTFKRMWLLSFVWNFTKTPGAAAPSK